MFHLRKPGELSTCASVRPVDVVRGVFWSCRCESLVGLGSTSGGLPILLTVGLAITFGGAAIGTL